MTGHHGSRTAAVMEMFGILGEDGAFPHRRVFGVFGGGDLGLRDRFALRDAEILVEETLMRFLDVDSHRHRPLYLSSNALILASISSAISRKTDKL